MNTTTKILAKVALCAVVLLATYMYGKHRGGTTSEQVKTPPTAPVNVPGNPKEPDRHTKIETGQSHSPKTDEVQTETSQRGSSPIKPISSGKNEPTVEEIGNDDPGDTGAETAVLEPIKLKGSSDEKKALLKALIDYRNKRVSSNAPDAIQLPDSLKDYWQSNGEIVEGDNPEDDTFINTINILTAALEDDDTNVRDAAFDAMFDLPGEMSDILAMQIVTGTDDPMKEALLQAAAQGSTESSVAFLMHALAVDNDAIKGKASDALKTLFSVEFKSSQDAFEWWETHRSSYVFDDNGISLAPTGDEAKEADVGIDIETTTPADGGDEIKKATGDLVQDAPAAGNDGGVEEAK